jgi:hypothetical protein
MEIFAGFLGFVDWSFQLVKILGIVEKPGSLAMEGLMEKFHDLGFESQWNFNVFSSYFFFIFLFLGGTMKI